MKIRAVFKKWDIDKSIESQDDVYWMEQQFVLTI